MDKEELVIEISRHFGLDEIISRILVDKGLTNMKDVDDFLYPKLDNLTPLSKYHNIFEITKRVQKAIKNEECIVLYGDYDCDGICGVSILYLYLKSQGANVHYFLPNRHTDGYGLSEKALERIAETYYPDLIITVDCGITNWDEVQYTEEVLGIEVIVTDHHEPLDQLPDCLIFNTKLVDDGGCRNLCGAGVALRLVESLAGLQESKKYYDIAALATVADIVPLLDDNRIIVYYGLKLINTGRRKGLKMLVDKCVKSSVKSSDIGFKLAPRINSVGRIGDANKVVNLFIENDSFILTNLINEIESDNDKRQELTNDLVEDCMESLVGYDFVNNPVIVLYNKYWDDGVLGIASAKLVSEFNRPVILLTKNGDYYKGSGRSVEDVNILECVKSVDSLLYKYGGHAMACGLSVSEDNLKDFIIEINKNCQRMYGDEFLKRKDHSFCCLDNISLEFARSLEMLEPYGDANREILFYRDICKSEFMQLGASNHIKYHNGVVDYLAYSSLDKLQLLNSSTNKRIYFTVGINEFRNQQTIQAVIQNVVADKIEGDLGLSEYLKQSEYGDRYNIECITSDEALSLSNETKYGVIYLTYDYNTYLQYESKLSKSVIHNNSFIDSLCPYNRIVFNPVSGNDLKYYDKIVFLEKPLSKACALEFNVNKNAQVYYIDNNIMMSKCNDSLVSYDKLGKIFIAVRHLLDSKVYTDLESIFRMINIEEITYDQFCIAMHIFMDLGIVKINNNGIIIDRMVKTNLDNSYLYKRIKEA